MKSRPYRDGAQDSKRMREKGDEKFQTFILEEVQPKCFGGHNFLKVFTLESRVQGPLPLSPMYTHVVHASWDGVAEV